MSATAIGFDYGTSHCSMGHVQDDQVRLIPLMGTQTFVPSTLFSWERPFIADFVASHLPCDNARRQMAQEQASVLKRARTLRDEWGFGATDTTVLFGDDAFAHYINDPTLGHYIRSPKSFLGSTGLTDDHIHFIEIIVTAMMLRFKLNAEQHLGHHLEQVVIGRPINFQGLRGEHSNRQALSILERAARLAGFKDVHFLYEPLAAGIDYETSLTQDQVVLVVDVGGGTTDCSLLNMGPQRSFSTERDGDVLAHCGQRIGGNDFDIRLSFTELMPLLGSQSTLKNGHPMPTYPYWTAVETNSVGAQLEFNSLETTQLLQHLIRESSRPDLVSRFARLQTRKTNFQLVAQAEHAKIQLSKQARATLDLSFVEPNLHHTIDNRALASAIDHCIHSIRQLIVHTLQSGQCQPDAVYITGGMGQSPLIRTLIHELLGDVSIVDGDYFGSVTAGLAKWAKRIFEP